MLGVGVMNREEMANISALADRPNKCSWHMQWNAATESSNLNAKYFHRRMRSTK